MIALEGRDLGGAERGLLELAAELRSNGMDVVVVLPGIPSERLRALAEGLRVQLHCERRRTAVLLTARRALSDSVFLLCGIRWSFLGRLFLGKRRAIVMQRGLDMGRSPITRQFDALTQRMVGLYIANSNAAARYLTDVVGIDESRVRILPNALERDWLTPPTTGPHGCLRIMAAGSERSEKRHDRLIDVLELASDVEWVATIYTTDGRKLRKIVAARGLTDRIVVIGGHALNADDYDRHDLFLHVSDSESSPRVILEAGGRNLRIVCTDVGDSKLLISPEDTVCRSDDIDSLVRAIRNAAKSVTRMRSEMSPRETGRPLRIDQQGARLIQLIQTVAHGFSVPSSVSDTS